MSEVSKSTRLGKAAQEFNVGVHNIVEFLQKKGIKIDNNPNTKLAPEVYALLVKEYQSEKTVKDLSKKIELEYTQHKTISITDKRPSADEEFDAEHGRGELFIRNMPPDHDKVAKPKPAAEEKPAEVKPVAEPEKKAEPVKESETPKPVVAAVEPEAKVQPVHEPVKETAGTAEVQPVAAEADDKHAAEPVKPEPEKVTAKADEPAEEEKSQIGQLKVLGKMDLDSLHKPSKKAKGKPRATETSDESPVKADEITVTPQVTTPKPETTVTESAPPVAAEKTEEAVVAEPEKPAEPVIERESNFLKTEVRKLEGVTILGTMKLPEARKPEPKKPVASSSDDASKNKKKKRKRIKKQGEDVVSETDKPQGSQPHSGQPHSGQGQFNKNKPVRDNKKGGPRRDIPKVELSPEDIQKQIKETLQRLSGGGKSKASKHRREKRSIASAQMAEEAQKIMDEGKTIMVAEFVTANELASLMNVQVNQIISTCLSLGLFVSINQRLDAETIVVVADEFGFSVKFVGVEASEGYEEIDESDAPEDLEPRAPIVVVMGHVDHGKTSLLDYIRHTNVIAGEAGGITQHIGAYEVKLENGKKITFLDTPGHEAFTAMRARGAKITDIVIIVIAADDTVMPQTVEAINHAQAAGVPIVFAINKIDKPNANTEKIREELSKRNILVEDWGGKYQSQEISAKKGLNVDLLLEKVLLEAELLELKANPNRLAIGTVLESSLDKGRGYVAKILVQNGTMNPGDLVLAGTMYGKVKAMYNERNMPIKEAGPSTPLLLLGLNGAPQAGDTFKVMRDEREAKNIATKRLQLQREQGIRTQKHITLDEIGRRIAIGDFKELNIIVKGDVDGSVEALADSLMKLTTNEVQVNIIHKSVGAVTESDVLLASASNAIIVGFQVRPSLSARKLAEQEQIDIRMYSIIYTAINEIKAAIEGMLSPEIEEKIVCNIEVREAFKITKVGTVAGCMVLDGKINRNTKIRIIRDGIVVYTGMLGSLKRFKDDVKEVSAGYECGLNIENFNDIKVKDIIEGYEEVEIKRKL
ncbi:MAG: translation initiation factor IF-2 [Bacteroidetes bacterium]|nr:MAG: translation initiation factor IF-2 [Bacteroidota bacterium]